MPRTWTPLTDEQLAAIAWADPAETTAALARRIAAVPGVVTAARQRMVLAGGWWCRLVHTTCRHCHQPLLAENTNRTVHRACNHAWRMNGQRVRRERSPAEQATANLMHHVVRDPLRLPTFPDDQRRTVAHAHRAGQRWTAEEDARLRAWPGPPTVDLAMSIGRTLHAVVTRQSVLRRAGRSHVPHPDPTH